MTRDDWQHASDSSLVVAIGRWHQEALAEVYRRHGGAVMALALRILRDRTMAEDIVQDVFFRLWNQPDRFDPERGQLRAFLLAQTHGRAVDMVRSETSRRAREEKAARQTAEAGYDLDLEVWDLTLAEQVRSALAGLNEGERQAIELAYFGGHTYRDVAAILGQPEGTVKSRIRLGMQRLRVSLLESGAVSS